MEVFTLSVPKSVVKFDKDGVKYISSVDKTQYLMKELERAALRDVGKFICRTFRKSYYSHFKRRRGGVGRYTQYWVRSKQPHADLQVGVKPPAFYGGFEELGSSKQPKLGLLSAAVQENIQTIVEIESQYLSALESEAAALAKINEADYEGGADE